MKRLGRTDRRHAIWRWQSYSPFIDNVSNVLVNSVEDRDAGISPDDFNWRDFTELNDEIEKRSHEEA